MLRNPILIIEQQAKKEYVNIKTNNRTYTQLQNSLTKCISKDKSKLSELRMETEQHILYLKCFNFENFMGVRIGLYGYIFAIFTVIFTSSDLQKVFKINDIKTWIYFFILLAMFMLISLKITTEEQKHKLIYLNFKLECINNCISQS